MSFTSCSRLEDGQSEPESRRRTGDGTERRNLQSLQVQVLPEAAQLQSPFMLAVLVGWVGKS